MPVNSLFMPFAPNCIRYGLYNVFEENENRLSYFHSAFLLNTFSVEDVDDEMILSLALYLHCGWIKILFEKKYISPADIEKSYKYVGGDEVMAFAASKFDENEQILLEMANDIAAGPLDAEVSGPNWLNNWIALCTAETEKVIQTGTPQHEILKQLHFQIQILINKHVGVTKDYWFVLYHFISKMIPVFFNRFVTV